MLNVQRLYNLDVFEYELDNPMALYGSIPFMTAHRPKQTTGVFLLNAAEMWIDIEKSNTGKGFTGMLRRLQEVVGGGGGQVPQTDTHWIAESGVIDMFVMLGSGPTDVFRQYVYIYSCVASPVASLNTLRCSTHCLSHCASTPMGSRVESPGCSSVGGDCARACSHVCARNFAPERLLTSVFFTPHSKGTVN